MSVWDALDKLGERIAGGAGNIVDAIATRGANEITGATPANVKENGTSVFVDVRPVGEQSGPTNSILDFVVGNKELVLAGTLLVGGILFYALKR